MCQLPLISMWVSRMRSPEKRMTIHLPSAVTLSMVRPASGVSSSTRARFIRTVSKRVTTRPPMARCRVRAARQMLSPSGTLFAVLGIVFGHLDYRCDAAHLKSHSGRNESGLFEELRQKMRAGGDALNLADQETGPASLPADRDLGQLLREFARDLRALRFVLRQKNADRGIAAAKERR